MAVMSRKKRAVAQSWGATAKQREDKNKPSEKTTEQEKITEEEHKKRVEMLKSMGLLK